MDEEQGISQDDAVGSIESLLGDDLNMLGDEVVEDDQQPAAATDAEPAEAATEEVDEDEPEADADADEDGEPEANAEVDDETLVDVQIGDDVYEVNFAELKAGYLRNEDYASKVQQLNADHESKVAELEEKQEQLLDELRLASVITTSDVSKYDTVNWEALKAQDPEQYKTLKLQAHEAKENAAKLEQRRQQVQALHNKAQQLKHAQYLRTQSELADKLIPGFREPETLKALLSYGKDVGYTEDEILNIADARHLLLLNNARLHAASVVRKKEAMASKVDKELPQVVKPGATKSRSSTDRQVVKSAKARLNSERSVDAAAAYLMTLDFDK